MQVRIPKKCGSLDLIRTCKLSSDFCFSAHMSVVGVQRIMGRTLALSARLSAG
jgi:hypothetical protein